MGVRKAFSTEEDEYLKQNTGRLSLGQMAQFLERPRSSVQYRIKKLGIQSDGAVYEVPKVKEMPKQVKDRHERLLELRGVMEGDIFGDDIPVMSRPAYYREYRALLAEIAELEGEADGATEAEPQSTFAQALAGLADQQRKLLERAAGT